MEEVSALTADLALLAAEAKVVNGPPCAVESYEVWLAHQITLGAAALGIMPGEIDESNALIDKAKHYQEIWAVYRLHARKDIKTNPPPFRDRAGWGSLQK